MAQALGAHGARIMLTDRDEATLRVGIDALTANGVEARGCAGDVTLPSDTVRAVEEMRARWGRVDIALCNAGIDGNAPAETISLEDWNRVIGINLTGVFFTAQACAIAPRCPA